MGVVVSCCKSIRCWHWRQYWYASMPLRSEHLSRHRWRYGVVPHMDAVVRALLTRLTGITIISPCFACFRNPLNGEIGITIIWCDNRRTFLTNQFITLLFNVDGEIRLYALESIYHSAVLMLMVRFDCMGLQMLHTWRLEFVALDLTPFIHTCIQWIIMLYWSMFLLRSFHSLKVVHGRHTGILMITC